MEIDVKLTFSEVLHLHNLVTSYIVSFPKQKEKYKVIKQKLEKSLKDMERH